MASKLHASFISICLLSVLSGCGWAHDQPKPSASFQSPTLDLSCLKVMPKQLQNLFEGNYTSSEADQAQVAKIWSCIDKGLSVFASYTRGANPNYYTANELQLFANRYFPVENALSDDFANAIFRLKRAVLGGTDTQLTQDEIKRLRTKMVRFGVIIAPLSANMGTLLNPSTATLPQKTRAAVSLSQFMLDFADLLADSENSLPWTDLGAFVTELEKYTSAAGTSNTALTLVREQLPIFQYLKLLLVGGDENLIEREKWRPIFQAISKVYNAIYLAEDSTQMFDDLSIDIQSTPENRQTAVKKITALLNFMKSDPNYQSRNTINLLSDEWAKALLVSAFLFPNNQGQLAVESFLGSPAIRQISGTLADELSNITVDTLNSAVVKSIATNVANLIEQASLANITTANTVSVFSLSTYRTYIQQLKPLLNDPTQADMLVAALDTFTSAQSILLNKTSDTLTPADFRVLIQKATDCYLAWSKDLKLSLEESIGETADAVRGAPSPANISAAQALATLNSLQNFFTLAKIKSSVNWDTVKSYVHAGFNAKALLLGDGADNISSTDLTTLNMVYAPFRKSADWTANLAEVAKVLSSNPFVAVKMDDLANAVDQFLPPGQKLAQLGLDAESLGYLKLILIGGDRTVMAPGDFSSLATVGNTIAQQVLPAVRALPPGFNYDLNSPTLEIARLGLIALGNIRPTGIPLTDIEGTILALTAKSGLTVRATTIDKLLIGLNQRVFLNLKTPKPTTLSGNLMPSNLNNLATLMGTLKADYADLEKSYQNVPNGTNIERADLLKTLRGDASLLFVQKTNPELDGIQHWLAFPPAGKKFTAFSEYDLVNKVMYYRALNWLFPFYELDDDTNTTPYPRLTINDLNDLMVDVNDTIFDFQLSLSPDGPTVKAAQYMQDINLFPTTGNGDNFVDTLESSEFLTMAGGGGILFDQAQKDLVHACDPLVTDINSITQVPMPCLLRTFFEPSYYPALYAPVIPQYADMYRHLDEDGRASLQKAALVATEPDLDTSDHILISDFETLVPLPYYLENIFERLDLNNDGLMQFSEAMAGFPLFCNSIAQAANFQADNCLPGHNPGLISAVYGYILLNGAPPSKSIFRELKFLIWAKLTWPKYRDNPSAYDQSITPLNRSDLLQIISNLSASTPSTAPAVDPAKLEASVAFFVGPPAGVLPGSR